MTEFTNREPILAQDIPVRSKASNYPEEIKIMLASKLQGREKRALGDFFGLNNFGVNLTRLAPNAVSALCHSHSKQDEFIYILSGRPTLQLQESRIQLSPGMCAGFKAASGVAHCLLNETNDEVIYLEVGDRTENDEATYLNDDLKARTYEGLWVFSHKDDTPY